MTDRRSDKADLFKILLYHCVEHFYKTRDTIYGQTGGKG